MTKWINPDGTRATCTQDACDLPVRASGLCGKHYQSARKSGALTPTRVSWSESGVRVSCSEHGCPEPVISKALCHSHYQRRYRESFPLTPASPGTDWVCPIPGCSRKMRNGSILCARCDRKRWAYGVEVSVFLELNRPENKHCLNPGCDEIDRLHMDHDHTCCPPGPGAKIACGNCVRGWLCSNCNTALGLLKENPRRIEGLLQYINNTSSRR